MTQVQREALIDLLTLAIYSDAHLSLAEEEALETAMGEQGWDSEYPRSLFIEKARARAREAAETEEATTAYVRARAAHFDTGPMQTAVYSIVHKVLSRDGMMPAEHAFLRMLDESFPAVGT